MKKVIKEGIQNEVDALGIIAKMSKLKSSNNPHFEISFLSGPPSSGKSTVIKRLTKLKDENFIDDSLILYDAETSEGDDVVSRLRSFDKFLSSLIKHKMISCGSEKKYFVLIGAADLPVFLFSEYAANILLLPRYEYYTHSLRTRLSLSNAADRKPPQQGLSTYAKYFNNQAKFDLVIQHKYEKILAEKVYISVACGRILIDQHETTE